VRLPIGGCGGCHDSGVLTTVVLVLAGITAWCVASLALALVVGPLVRKAGAHRGTEHGVMGRLRSEHRPATGSISIPIAMVR
jgi:hypothetical protein